MAKKDNINEEDIEFLQELFGESKENNILISELKDLKESKIKIAQKPEGIEFSGQIKKESDKNNLIQKEQLRSNKIGMKTSSDLLIPKDSKRELKKRKIKKKELFLEIAEALPLIKENNRLLNELIQYYKSLENSFKALTQEPIKIKILK